MGFDCDDKGRIKLTTDGRHTINIAERTMPFEEKTYQMFLCQIKLVQVVQNQTIVGRLKQVKTLQFIGVITKVLIW